MRAERRELQLKLSWVWQARDEAWQHGFSLGHEALKGYLLLNPGGNLSSLDLDSVVPSPTTIVAGAQVGVDLVPIAFQATPATLATILSSLELGPVEPREEDYDAS